jgi:hypothetical protein
MRRRRRVSRVNWRCARLLVARWWWPPCDRVRVIGALRPRVSRSFALNERCGDACVVPSASCRCPSVSVAAAAHVGWFLDAAVLTRRARCRCRPCHPSRLMQADPLFLRGELKGHTGWVTAIATTDQNPNLVVSSSRGVFPAAVLLLPPPRRSCWCSSHDAACNFGSGACLQTAPSLSGTLRARRASRTASRPRRCAATRTSCRTSCCRLTASSLCLGALALHLALVVIAASCPLPAFGLRVHHRGPAARRVLTFRDWLRACAVPGTALCVCGS